MKDTGKSSSRKLRRAIYYTLHRPDPQKTHYKNSFSAKISKNHTLGKNPYLREFVFNSRHPDPRRVLGRCGAAVRGPDPRDPRDPGMGSLFRILGVFCDRSETLTPPETVLGSSGGTGRLWGALGQLRALWEARGRVQKSLGGAPGRPIYRQTPDIVETQDMCLVESQDICLVETPDMCCVES